MAFFIFFIFLNFIMVLLPSISLCINNHNFCIQYNNSTKLHIFEESLENSISCNPNYYYNIKENKCLLKEFDLTYCKKSKDGKKCEECDEGYYFDGNGICIESQFCSESFNFQCTKCIPDHYLSIFKLCTATEHCYLVDKNSSLCTSCVIDYYLNKNDNKCYSNFEDSPYKYCKVVINEDCIRCEYGFFLSKNYKCSNSKYCKISENGICLQCLENYFLGLDNICTNIEKCIYSLNDICEECEDGYYYNKVYNKCLEMKDIFLNCKYTCDLGDKCCACKKDYYLNSTDSLCYDNSKEGPFYKCAYVNEEQKCEYCIDNYYLGDYEKKCTKVEYCKISKNEYECLECENFFCFDVKNQKCLYNDYISDINNTIYYYCLRTNEEGTKCEKCIDGYEANEKGYCVDIDYCEERKDGKCLKCKDLIIDNYHLCSNERFGCIKIFYDNCLRCDNLALLGQCTECKEGYIKQRIYCEKIE